MAIAVAGLGSNTGSGGASSIAATLSSISAGDTVIVHALWQDNGGSPGSVSDGVNTYDYIGGYTPGGSSPNTTGVWICSNALAVASPTLTLTFSANNSYRGIFAAKVTGLPSAKIDQSSFIKGTTTAIGPLSSADEVIFEFATRNPAATPGQTSGFTSLYNGTIPSGYAYRLSYLVVSSTSAVTSSPTNTTGDMTISLTSYQASPFIGGFNMPMLGM